MQNPTNNQQNDVYAFSVRNILITLFKRKWLLLSVFAAIVILITVISFVMPTVYKSSSKVLVEQEIDSDKALLFRMNLTPSFQEYDWVNSEVEIIQSYPIAARVVQTLQNKGEAFTTLSPQDAIEKLKKNLNVENFKKTNVIDIHYKATQPQVAARVVNTIVQQYILYRSELAKETESYKFLQQQFSLADEKLKELEKKQADFKKNNKVLSPDSQNQILLNRLLEYEKNLTAVRTKRIGKEAKLAVIQDQIKNGMEINIPTTETSDSPSREKYIAKLKGELLDAQIRREVLLQKFTPQYEKVIELDKQIDAINKKISNEINQIVEMEKASIRALEAEEHALENSILSIHAEIEKFAGEEYEYKQLSRGIKDNQEIYSMLLKQREEARISLSKLGKGVKIKVINAAIAPKKPVLPNKKLNIALGILFGVFLSLTLVFLVEYFDHKIYHPEELTIFTGLPVLGSIRNWSLRK